MHAQKVAILDHRPDHKSAVIRICYEGQFTEDIYYRHDTMFSIHFYRKHWYCVDTSIVQQQTQNTIMDSPKSIP